MGSLNSLEKLLDEMADRIVNLEDGLAKQIELNKVLVDKLVDQSKAVKHLMAQDFRNKHSINE